MARIRTIKPEFFRHEGLWQAEVETSLPLRLAFAGLLTVCDREGRFRWQPRAVKLDCLPYDDIDFSRVLDALGTRGFVVKYEHEGNFYGYVPGFARHQVINNREAASILPNPLNCIEVSTRAPRVVDACPTPLVHAQGEGKGREGKGRGRERVEERARTRATSTKGPADAVVPSDWIEAARALREKHRLPPTDLELEAVKFQNYWSANGQAKIDWRRTWSNWAINSKGSNNGRTGHTLGAFGSIAAELAGPAEPDDFA
jgi:hypothetical protein